MSNLLKPLMVQSNFELKFGLSEKMAQYMSQNICIWATHSENKFELNKLAASILRPFFKMSPRTQPKVSLVYVLFNTSAEK